MSMPASDLVIGGGRCLLPGRGVVAADIVCSGEHIAEIRPAGASRGAVIDATDCLVLPGIVDIHGDAFERQIMPRPKVIFPLDMAMLDSDRQLVANGITTAFHGITISWEPGLRSLEQSMRVIESLDRLEPVLQADNRLHLRWETFALDELDEVRRLLARPKTPLLAFNDHTTHLMKVADVRSAVSRHAERSMVEREGYLALYEAVYARRAAVPAAIMALAETARLHAVPMLSHDDRSPEERAFYRGLGASIAEFPITGDTLDASAKAGDVIVLGAPNVVRGGSHTGAINAEEAISNEQCTILASDYYYPAPLRAALALVERGTLPLEEAWMLISAAPATAAGLADRGRIAEGLRADLVVLCARERRPVATICAGRPVYRSR
ncbi:alpha-D-ribose 1-methylphosphonate 5-triphosphate diphosphatase [Aestuariivirga sp.]|uniref:alpha-D-ribose 1-methylphosphonate 5-triphosphate diphosphatase n=1 Tax=Aestuariivirga sp. TaxID=2650926 RepID=UPI0030169B12